MVTKRFDALCATTICATDFIGTTLKATTITATTLSATTLSSTNVYSTTITGQAWDDIRIAGLAIKTNASAPELIALSGGLLIYGFDGNATLEQGYFVIQMPHTYKTGTDLHPHVHWAKSVDATGNVVWFLEYALADINAAYPSTTTISAVCTAAVGAWIHTKSDLPVISSPSITGISSMLVGRLYRNPADALDTYEFDAGLLEFDIHYQVDGIGSDTEDTKAY